MGFRLPPLGKWDGSFLPSGLFRSTPLDLRIVGRTLLHAALVGVAAGLVGAALFAAIEYLQVLVLERYVGYRPLRAFGEEFAAGTEPGRFQPWLLLFVPAVGGLLTGWVTRWAPETRGGGGNAMISTFHQRNASIPRRVVWIKAIASIATLGSGGAGGREGPTMQIGGALGVWVARTLGVGARERRILLVAGVAAGISAVFRTPLGAALLAVEILYRDGFESDALIPSVLSSVVAYSVVISIFGESTLFGQVPRFPFVPAHLPLFALLALVTAAMGALFIWVFAHAHKAFDAMPVPAWTKPALGGLLLGALVVPLVLFVGFQLDAPGEGLGLLGGGYGAVQMAISGNVLLPIGWAGVGLLTALAFTKILASALTIGSGGSAGDFAPALAVGGLLGGAFGRAAGLLLDDPRLQPGAFALVGMSAFYGGIANAPLSALVLTCELAGNYDLLVPLMLCQGITFVALRKKSIYPAQVATPQESPVYRDLLLRNALVEVKVQEVLRSSRAVPIAFFRLNTSAEEMLKLAADAHEQEVFPVTSEAGKLLGVVTSTSLRVMTASPETASWTFAVDLMERAATVTPLDDLSRAMRALVDSGLRELPVVDANGQVVELLDETDVAGIYLKAVQRAESADRPTAF